MYKYKFPIGDWSGDGHGQCKWFIISGQKPVQDVREAHFKCEEVFGFSPGEMCSEYQNPELSSEIKSKLKEILGEKINLEDIYIDEILIIWISMLNHVDPDLKLEVIKDDIPIINFYEFDKKERHLKVPGYGLFE